MDRRTLQPALLELVRKTSAELPADVSKVILQSLRKEAKDTTGRYAMEVIQANIALAEEKSLPLCQDTGSILFFVHGPEGTRSGRLPCGRGSGRRRGDEGRLPASELGRFADRKELGHEPGSGQSDNSLRAVEGRVGRRTPDPQGRRLRERRSPVLPSEHRAWRRPRSCRRREVHPRRGQSGAGKGVRPRCPRRRDRRRSRLGLRLFQGAAPSHARRQEPQQGPRAAGEERHGEGQLPRDRADGIRRNDDPARLQGRRAEPSPRLLLRQYLVHVLGVSAPGGRPRLQGPDPRVALLRRMMR